jgi:hypothetical protein
VKRWLLLLVACSSKEEPVRDGVSRVHVHVNDTYLDLTYTLKLLAKPDPLAINKAACQVGGDRFITQVYTSVDKLINGNLPGRPTTCELELYGERFCMTDEHFTRGACAPNPVGPANHLVSARLESVKGEDKDSLGFPAHLTLYYVITAHADLPKGAYAVQRTSCGNGSDTTWHNEAQLLRAGESFRAGQNTYRLGRPAPGTMCRTTFSYAPAFNGELTVVGEACHVDDKIVPCA